MATAPTSPTVTRSISAAVNRLALERVAIPVRGAGSGLASLACQAFALSCLAVMVFADLATPFVVVPLGLAEPMVFLLTLRACVAELRCLVLFVASLVFVLAERVACSALLDF